MHDPQTVAWEIHRPWPERRTRHSGRRYWPALITIWHHDPGDYDSNDQCPYSGRWRWHVHHWRFQWHTYQHLRRSLLTRCEWCGGKSRKGGRVNCGKGWHDEKSPWWRGEIGLYHSECLSAESAWNCCTCEVPVLGFYDAGHPREYGECEACGRWRQWGLKAETSRWAERWRSEVSPGARPGPDLLARERLIRSAEAPE